MVTALTQAIAHQTILKVFIDREAGEIMRLVVTVCLFVCLWVCMSEEVILVAAISQSVDVRDRLVKCSKIHEIQRSIRFI